MVEKRTGNGRVIRSITVLTILAITLNATTAAATTFRATLPTSRYNIIGEALAVRDGTIPPLSIVAADTVGSAVARNVVMSTTLNMRARVPDLGRAGYHLAGMRLYSGVPGGNAIELVYRASEGRLITLYVRHSSTGPRFDQFSEHGTRICVWQDDVIGTVVVGKISAPEMQRVAGLAYSGL